MKQKLLKALWLFTGLGLMGILSVIVVVAYFSFGLPKISSMDDYKPPVPSEILAKDGTVLASIGKQNRSVATFDEIPQIIIDAFLSAEDSEFYEHEGVDYIGIIRAAIANLKAGRVVQGGSTITQQVAKSLLLSNERSIIRKIKDVLLARKIEEKFTKKEILFLYLNQVYFGGGYYGVKAAFNGYFGKTLSEATVAESAMIAGLLVAPGRYSPYLHPDYAKKRQSYVLGRLRANKKITEDQYQAALKEKIKYRIKKGNQFKAGYFTDWVRQRVIKLVGEDKFLTNGFKVVTTLDWQLQQVAEKEVRKGIEDLDKRQGYKGPLGRFETQEEIEENRVAFRKKTYKDSSNFFILSDELTKMYELEFDEERYAELKAKQEERRKEIGTRRFPVGYNNDDPLVEQLKVNEKYKAVVTRVDNAARLIYADIGGVPVIINYPGFRWAHERTINVDRHYYSYILHPSKIVAPGDIILVKVMNKKASAWRYAYKTFRTRNEKHKKLPLFKKERFILGKLDQMPDAQGALFSISPHTGEVLAFVGGYDFKKSQFNRIVQSLRQPGSSFKPIMYAAALENGFKPNSLILDSPEALGGSSEGLNWKPSNYDGKFLGPMTFRRALEVSRNIPSIKIAGEVGVDTIHKFADRIGFNAKIDPDLSMSLGSFGVSLKELVSTYSIFPNGGKIVDVKSIISIEDRDGNVFILDESDKMNKIRMKEAYGEEEIEAEEEVVEVVASKSETEPEKENTEGSEEGSEAKEEEEEVNQFHESLGGAQVYDKRLAYIMTNLLKGVVQSGTGRKAKEISQFIGGKTGTTNNYVDAWFIGFSANVATGVWTGFDDNKTLGWPEGGGVASLPVWKEYMKSTIQKYGERDFSVPRGIVNVAINKKTGKLAKSGDSQFIEAFVEGSEPNDDEDSALKDLEDKGSEAGLYEEEDYYNVQ